MNIKLDCGAVDLYLERTLLSSVFLTSLPQYKCITIVDVSLSNCFPSDHNAFTLVVVHVATTDRTYRNLVYNRLIYFPSAGVFGVPKNIIAEEACRALEKINQQFLQHDQQQHLKIVRFVNIDLETTQVFVSVFSATHQPDAGASGQRQDRSRGIQTHLSNAAGAPDHKAALNFISSAGSRVEVFCGDLLSVVSDAVVCSVNTNLSPRGGTAEKIANAAGDQMIRECQDLLDRRSCNLEVTDVVHVTAGNLTPNIRHVILGVTLTPESCSDSNGFHIAMVNTYYNCLQYANNTLNISSISLPAILAGKTLYARF